MGSDRRNLCTWWGSQSSSSMKLLLFIVPLILVAGFISILGGPNPILNPTYVTSSSSNGGDGGGGGGVVTTTNMDTQSDAKKLEGSEGLVVVAVDFHNKEVKAISDDSVFNHSSTPPLSIQAIETPQQFVSPSLFIFNSKLLKF